MFRFIKNYAFGLLVLLITLIVLFGVLAVISGHTPAPISTVARKAASLAQPHG